MRELKTILREIILEVGELKERIAVLELAQQEQYRGQALNAAPAAAVRESGEASAATASQTDSQPLRTEPSSLEQLYHEGYHVCPMAFGEERTDGCLFCMAMLARGDA